VECFERGAQPFQSSAHRLCSSAKPNSEVLRLLEEFSWHYAGFNGSKGPRGLPLIPAGMIEGVVIAGVLWKRSMRSNSRPL
jgi:hypothetical protein